MITLSLVLTAVMALSIAALIFKNRRDLSRALLIFVIGIIVLDCILLLPMILGEMLDGKNPVLAFLYTLQICSMNANYDVFVNASEGISSTLFRYLFLALNVLSPLAFAGFIASFFKGAISTIKYVLFSCISDVCYFSELNSNSLSFAKDIIKNKPKTLIVFCSSDFASEKEQQEAYRHGCILFSKPETEFTGKSRHRRYYFEISSNQDENLKNTQELLRKLRSSKRIAADKIKIYMYSQQEEAALSLSSTDKKGMAVILVNRWRLAAYNLLFSEPLYASLRPGSKSMRILLVGSGKMGHELLKAALWAYQMGTQGSITVIDKNAEWYRSRLRLECPEFFGNEYSLSFFNADVLTDNFEHILKEHCPEMDYIAVALGDDSLNIKTALYLRSFYLRTSQGFNCEPKICVHIDSDTKAFAARDFAAVDREKINRKGWSSTSLNAQNYGLTPFGMMSECYSYQFIVNSAVERIALNAHAAYEQMFSDGKESTSEILASYNLNEVNKNSNRANAIHLLYKLFLLGYIVKPHREASDAEISQSAVLVDELSQKLNDEETLETLARIEHDRWNAYMRGEGYIGASIEQAQTYSKTVGSHKYIRARMNACICPYDALDNVCAEFDPKLKDYDKTFIQNSVYILGLKENPNINISGIKNVLVR